MSFPASLAVSLDRWYWLSCLCIRHPPPAWSGGHYHQPTAIKISPLLLLEVLYHIKNISRLLSAIADIQIPSADEFGSWNDRESSYIRETNCLLITRPPLLGSCSIHIINICFPSPKTAKNRPKPSSCALPPRANLSQAWSSQMFKGKSLERYSRLLKLSPKNLRKKGWP
jgi:hypothetical protein